jgi:hypothetical protein
VPRLPPSNVWSTPESFCWICKVETIVVDRSYTENVSQLYVTYKVIHGNCFNRMKGLHSNAHNFRVVSVVIFISDSWNKQKNITSLLNLCMMLPNDSMSAESKNVWAHQMHKRENKETRVMGALCLYWIFRNENLYLS